MSIFDSGSPGIAIALDVPWPANVSSGPGVQVDKTTGQWAVGLDFPTLVDGGSPATPSNVYLAGYDTALLRYEKLRLDNVIASASGVDSRTVIGNTDYAVLITDRYIGLAANLTAIRTITLPAASSVPPGRLVTLQDETGGISDAFYLAIAVTGADTVNGGSTWILKTTRGGATFRSNGTNAWNVLVPTGRSPVADTNYTATRGDQMIAYTSISAGRVVTLPAASAFQVGGWLMVIDESGSCSGTNTITVARAGADTINGVTSTVIGQAYGYVALESNGVSKWTIVDTAALSSGAITSSQISDSTALGRADIGATRGVAGNAVYTILTTDRIVVTSVALTLPRIWTLPLANAVPAGTEIVLSDETGVATATNTISIARAGSDTINGAAGNQAVLGTGVRQKQSVRSDGVSNWVLSSLSGPLNGSPIGATTPSTGVFTTLAVAGDPTLPLQAATKQYVDAVIPSGTVMLFYQAAAPTGWTKLTSQNDKAIRVVSGSGGVAGGTNAFSTVMAQTTTGNHTLTLNETPTAITSAGNNVITVYPDGNSATYAATTGATGWGTLLATSAGALTAVFANSGSFNNTTSFVNSSQPISVTSNNTGGQPHNHPITMSIAYIDVLLCSKN